MSKFKIILAFGCLCLPACSHDPIGKTYPVTGTVDLDGAPLKTGSVAFFPAGEAKDAPAFEAGGRIKEDGTYNLSTRGKPGALLGTYKVTIISQSRAAPDKPTDFVSLVPVRYTNKETTPLKVEVTEQQGDGKYDLHLKSK